MAARRTVTEIRLVNGSTGDPCLFVDYPGRDDAILFDAGENGALDAGRLGDLAAVFITHHHVDHFMGLDRIVRANLDRDKTLHVFGPDGTIRRIYDRIKSYEYPYFPFMKLVLDVRDVLAGTIRRAPLSCPDRFPEPAPVETAWEGPTLFETAEWGVEAAPVDHTVPCLAYALVEKPGYHPIRARLADGPLRPGPWVTRALGLLRAGAPGATPVAVDGFDVPLADLAGRFFEQTRGGRLAYVVDTAWSEAARPALLRLAHRARVLYCDSFYAKAQARQAEKHRHMTAAQAAEFARLAKVEELVLLHFAARYAGQYSLLVDEARAGFPKVSAVLD